MKQGGFPSGRSPLLHLRKMAKSDFLISFGDAIKMSDSGLLTGRAITFGSPDQLDLDDEYFTKDTYFGRSRDFDLFYAHGQDPAMKRMPIGSGKLTYDDAGAWFEAQLELANQYREYVEKLIKMGKLGYSSGAVGHLVEKKQIGQGRMITSWPIGEMSATPIPSEHRNVLSIKSLKESLPDFEFSAFGETKMGRLVVPVTIKLTTEMADNETPAVTPQAPQTAAPVNNAPEPKSDDSAVLAELKSMKAELEAIKAQGGKNVQPTYSAPPSFIKRPGDTYENAFAAYLLTGETKSAGQYIDNQTGGWKLGSIAKAEQQWTAAKAMGVKADEYIKAVNDSTWNITTDADGGYLVPTPVANEIVARRGDDLLANQLGVRRIPGGKGTTINLPVDDENQFGEAFVSTSESSAFSRDQAALNQVAFTYVKYTKKMDFTYELLQDAQDTGVLLSFVGDYIGRARAITHNQKLITELDTAGGSTIGKAAASATAVTAAELKAVVYIENLGPYIEQDLGSVNWLTSRANLGSAMALASSNIFTLDNTPGGSGIKREMFGYPVKVGSSIPAIAAGVHSFYFGNWYFMGLREDPELQVLRDPYSRAGNGEVIYHYYTRFVYNTIQSQAIVHLLQKKT